MAKLADLPNEVLCVVADYLRHDKASLAGLAATSSQMHHVVILPLYQDAGRALLWGARHGVLETVQRAVAVGNHVDDLHQEAVGCTGSACPYCHGRVDTTVDENGAHDVHWTALHLAAAGGHERVVKYLLKAGADVYAYCHHMCDCEPGYDLSYVTLQESRITYTDFYHPVHVALCHGQLGVARLLAKAMKASPYDPLTDSLSIYTVAAIHEAAKLGYVEFLQYLVRDCCLDVNLEDGFGNTALHHAAASPRGLPVLHALKDLGADLDHSNHAGLTALGVSIFFGYFDTAHWLMEAGAALDGWCEPEQGDDPGVLYVCSCRTGSWRLLRQDFDTPVFKSKVAKLMSEALRRGARVEGSPDHDSRPLSAACARLNLEGIEVLLHAGADPDGRGLAEHKTPLMYLCSSYLQAPGDFEHRFERPARLLLSHGADVSTPDDRGRGVLWHAVFCPSSSHDPAGEPRSARDWYAIQVLELVLEFAADANPRDEDGNSLLAELIDGCTAAYRNRWGLTSPGPTGYWRACVQRLIAHGASLDEKNSSDKEAVGRMMFEALATDDRPTVELLLAAGSHKFESPSAVLWSSLMSDAPKIANFLVRSPDLDLGWADAEGNSLLHCAAIHPERFSYAQALLERGADRRAVNFQGETAAERALAAGFAQRAEALRAVGAL
ncbi:ankyrin [Thozetella sp. PMI_491]|nr:ankyrin [Thozetella sp. PMI_491]